MNGSDAKSVRKTPPDLDPLLSVVRNPAKMLSFEEREWDSVLPRARAGELLVRLAEDAHALGIEGRLPRRVQRAFASARTQLAQQIQVTTWEIDRIGLALSKLPLPTILLKGAAYIAREFPLARKRFCADIDILVPSGRLSEVEGALHDAGWKQQDQDEYDEFYYRRWMHELPPMVHSLRGLVLDVHHAILPKTTRHSPPTEKLLSELWPIEVQHGAQTSRELYTLSPRDMVLHSAAHLFHDSEPRGGMRGLVDLHDLLTYFSTRERFWDALLARAVELQLGRSLFYGTRYASLLFGTPVPSEARNILGKSAPPAPALRIMDSLVRRAFVPPFGEHPRQGELSIRLLYIRSHLLRMPLHLLAPHLLRKAARRARQE